MRSTDRKPAWRRHGHLIAGVVVTVAAMLAVGALHFWASGIRSDVGSVVDLALDTADSFLAESPPEATEALHLKLMTAIDELAAPGAVESLRNTLAEIGPTAISGDGGLDDQYTRALGDTIRAVQGHSGLRTIRTQQIQMGIIAGAAIFLILLIRSVAARRQPEVRTRRAHHPAQIDPLTGLGRIEAVRERLAELLDRDNPGFVGLLVVGIQPEHEHFLPLTRAQLDTALLETSRRLRTAVRSTDLVVRLARDELAVAMPTSPRVEDPGRVASKILGALDEPIVAGDVTVRPNPRVGIAIAPLDAITPDGMLQRGRVARRAASDAPAPVYRSYSDRLAPTQLGSLEMVEQLNRALADRDGQLWVAYQPKIDLITERVVGFEALARWDHPRLGSIPPSEFIPVAEQSDLIISLGAWVLDKVCAQIAAWRLQIEDAVPVSVNVSGRQFEDGKLATLIRSTLARHKVPPELLELELTEGILVDDRPDLIGMMRDLSDLGVKLAVDDFGTGFSALSYLQRFPIDVLKIDRTFIRDLQRNDGDEAISTAIISMAHSMALKVVAEGVETPEQLSVLRTLGCDAAQGFYFAHPARPAEIEHRTASKS